MICHSAVKESTSLHLVELWWVDPCRAVVEQQLIAELGFGHGPDISHFEEILNGGTAVDVHGSCVCTGLQQHLHQDVIAVPGGLVESCFMVLLLEVRIWTRRAMLVKTDPEASIVQNTDNASQEKSEKPCRVAGPKTHPPVGLAGGDRQYGGPGCRFAL